VLNMQLVNFHDGEPPTDPATYPQARATRL
jgi:hypothetical protein